MKFKLLLILLLSCKILQAQIKYQNEVYQSNIKTVQLYNSTQESSFPIIGLHTNDVLLLGFDDLNGGTKTYNYTIEHCDADWRPSGLSPSEYLQSFTEDRIMDYRYSFNTKQKYTHYQLKLPNYNIIPKLSGNYLLKVYPEGNPSEPILTRRFYVVDNKAGLAAGIIPSNNVVNRSANQKINFSVNISALSVQNPYAEIRTIILQNGRNDVSTINTNPQFVQGGILQFNDFQTNDFAGGNEFRRFDLRTLLAGGEHINRIYRDTANTVMLMNDKPLTQTAYTFQYDNDGKFFILNTDGRDPRTDADYAHVYFNLNYSPPNLNDAVFITGKFNDWRLDESSKMNYDASRGNFYTDLYLKQGIYDYHYVLKQNQEIDQTSIDGSHFETENDYQFLVYFRRTGSRYEELVGYQLINTTKGNSFR
ncbi:type IX secretion system plug protein [Mucilaginibacter arboris]|uniref:DUF5103 domain-containing protein n=1 Tax=Mucilaginibacter arboris TaxID=2682090 RepID=A0A7K1SXG5_9SPHI|nr:DUF5103 domain-containing protein [Mucilaginibacter arboris]MVN21927.1 DUF5103 domain-containing protein [Mucilaginibacter arboris]